MTRVRAPVQNDFKPVKMGPVPRRQDFRMSAGWKASGVPKRSAPEECGERQLSNCLCSGSIPRLYHAFATLRRAPGDAGGMRNEWQPEK